MTNEEIDDLLDRVAFIVHKLSPIAVEIDGITGHDHRLTITTSSVRYSWEYNLDGTNPVQDQMSDVLLWLSIRPVAPESFRGDPQFAWLVNEVTVDFRHPMRSTYSRAPIDPDESQFSIDDADLGEKLVSPLTTLAMNSTGPLC